MFKPFRIQTSQEILCLVIFSYIICFFNIHFFKTILSLLPFKGLYAYFFEISLCAFSIFMLSLLFLCLSNQFIIKPLLFIIVIASTLIHYFEQKYKVFFTFEVFQSVIETHITEAKEYFNLSMLKHVICFACLPIIYLFMVKFPKKSLWQSLKSRIKNLIILIICSILILTPVYHKIPWTLDENQYLLDQIIPLNLFSSTFAYIKWKYQHFKTPHKKRIDIYASKFKRPSNQKPRFIVLVIGETVRAANWGLNSYARNTTPLLSKTDIINFQDVSSCGTVTNISVPCMLSPLGQHAYNRKAIVKSESLLHLLNQTGVSVLWRDNQYGCRGVCDHIPYEQMSNNRICQNKRCLDDSLLYNFESLIPKNQDMLLVLHMIGNHGPAYFLRYPEKFEYWKPACHSNDFSNCNREEIVNAYDNAIFFTDYILAKLIERLKKIKSHQTGMIYLSDHGESLGENNIYLHGLPLSIAPIYQKKVPMVVWLSADMYQTLRLQKKYLKNKETKSLNQDYLFSSLLRLFGIRSKLYRKEYDLFAI